MKDEITKIFVDGSSQEGENISPISGRVLLRNPLKWTVHPRRMRCFEVHKKDKLLFKSIKWMDPSVKDGITEILVDDSSQEDEIF